MCSRRSSTATSPEEVTTCSKLIRLSISTFAFHKYTAHCGIRLCTHWTSNNRIDDYRLLEDGSFFFFFLFSFSYSSFSFISFFPLAVSCSRFYKSRLTLLRIENTFMAEVLSKLTSISSLSLPPNSSSHVSKALYPLPRCFLMHNR